MANHLLKSVFKNIFDKNFQPDVMEDRLKMQIAIYLLQDMGISVGDYSFMWYNHGLYSQALQNDILDLKSVENLDVKYSADAQREMGRLKNAISQDGIQYDVPQWIECLGSVQYIKENLLPSSAKDNDIIKELESRKPHLNKNEDNKRALQTLKELMM